MTKHPIMLGKLQGLQPESKRPCNTCNVSEANPATPATGAKRPCNTCNRSAIEYLNANFKDQPALEDIAAHVHLSPFQFQRIFTEWAGVSPKKFLQLLSLEHAKRLLREGSPRLSDTAYCTGLSGTSRLHDLFVNIEAMTPAEYRWGPVRKQAIIGWESTRGLQG